MLGLQTTGHSHERKRVWAPSCCRPTTKPTSGCAGTPSCGCHMPTLPPPRSAEWPPLQGSLGMVGCKPCDLRRREGDRITAHSADSPQQPGPGAWGVQGSPSTLAKICSPEVPSDSTRTSRDRDRGRSPATWILCAPARGRPAPGKARERQLCYNEAETWMLRGQVRRHAPRTSPKSPRAGGVQGAPGRGLR